MYGIIKNNLIFNGVDEKGFIKWDKSSMIFKNNNDSIILESH